MLVFSAEDQANMLLNLARNVSNLNSSQVDRLLSQLENLLAGPNISLALGNTSVQIVSSLMGASLELLSNFSKRFSKQFICSLCTTSNAFPSKSEFSLNSFNNCLNTGHKLIYFLLFRIINIVDTVGLKLILGTQPETLLSSDVALSVSPTDGTNFQEILFTISDPNNVQV